MINPHRTHYLELIILYLMYFKEHFTINIPSKEFFKRIRFSLVQFSSSENETLNRTAKLIPVLNSKKNGNFLIFLKRTTTITEQVV